MKVKKIILTMVSTLILCAMAFGQTAYAATNALPELKDGKVYFVSLITGVNYDINYEEGKQYALGNNIRLINKIGLVENPTASEINYSKVNDAYCAKAGQGFEYRDYIDGYNYQLDDLKNGDTYINFIDKYISRDELADGRDEVNTGWGDNYNNILRLTDLFYLENDNFETYKNGTLKEALKSNPELWVNLGGDANYSNLADADLLNVDQIKAIQQAALWYFTNSDDNNYHKENLEIFCKENNEGIYKQIVDETDVSYLGSEANALYKYLIETAKVIPTGNTQRDTKVYFYTNASSEIEKENTQPVIVLKREKKEFDLALRKYISSITTNGTTTDYTSLGERMPNVDPDILVSGEDTTAEYKHAKDPIKVENGSVVRYRLSIYNEGEIDGRATKVIDQLPEGLIFVRVVSGNFVSDGTYDDESNNRLTLVRKENKTDNLLAFNPDTMDKPDYEEIEIECVVVVDESIIRDDTGVFLTNIAWIAEDYNDKGVKDRDSVQTQPLETLPKLVTDSLGYTGLTTYTTVNDLKDKNTYYKGQEDDDDFEKIYVLCPKGKYDIVLVKEDKSGSPLNDENQTATFELKDEKGTVTKTVNGTLTIVSNKEINTANFETPDVYEIRETIPPDEYCAFDGVIKIEVYKKRSGSHYIVENIKYYVDNVEVTENREDLDVFLNTNGNIEVHVRDYQFDLALRKFITKIATKSSDYTEYTEYTAEGNRVPKITGEQVIIDTETNAKETTTAEKQHTKNKLAVAKGDKVTYTIRIYNEGQIDGYAAEVTDYLPEGLSLIPQAQSEINTTYNWVEGTDANGKAVIKSTYLKDNNKVITAADDDFSKLKTEGYYQDLQVECIVNDKATTNNLKNIAAITKYEDKNGKEVTDRDSDDDSINTDKYNPKNSTDGIGEQDDDDFEDLQLQELDLALRKFITRVADNADMTGATEYDRAPIVSQEDIKKLFNGEITTANYNHTKKPLKVNVGDYVEYTLRVYNEGSMEGYAREITDHLPEYLEYVNCEANKTTYKWNVSEDGRTVTTDYLKDFKLPEVQLSYNIGVGRDLEQYVMYSTSMYNREGNDNELKIICKVKDTIPVEINQTNIAEITKYGDKDNTPLDVDRDSQTIDNNKYNGLVDLPEDKDLPNYKKDEIDSGKSYIPGQQDDDDFEKIYVPKFDLALRKFITKVEKVNEDNTREDRYTKADYDARVPQISQESYEKLIKGETTTLEYTHSKEPMNTVQTDIVTYTLRVYNEGNMAGYASVITDDIPEGVVFLPEDATNVKYGWKMFEELPEGATAKAGKEMVELNINESSEVKKYVETDDVSKAKIIRTDYLSRENGATENLIKALDKENGLSDANPDYRDVQVAFKVVEPYRSDRIIINYAQISKDQDEDGDEVTDIDSHTDEWIKDEDDQDIEKIRVPQFDLALRKWVTQAIVTENGETTVTETGHQPFDDPEEVVKVELHRKKLSNVTVKFRYSIRVYNDGYDKETGAALPGYIAGYAKEVKDHIPEGLKFLPEDNPDWKDEGNNIITTRKLENTLLKPGEFADVEVVLTWINGNDNLGLKINYAEISEDDNDWDVPDNDSTPDNMKERHEDDDDDAPVILSVSTGVEATYIVLGLSVLITIAGGIALIKKFVM
ncbi:MAG: DUF11 domain-containing protein [Clostridia bacterium]|nr:DUF11 domain-containing protein [Clostridia bacterium]